MHSLGDEVPESQLRARLEHISYLCVFTLVLLHHLVNQELNLRISLEVRQEDFLGTCLRDRDRTSEGMIAHISLSLAAACVCLLETGVLIAVFELIQGLFTSVEFLQPAQVPSIDQQVLLDGHIERAFR